MHRKRSEKKRFIETRAQKKGFKEKGSEKTVQRKTAEKNVSSKKGLRRSAEGETHFYYYLLHFDHLPAPAWSPPGLLAGLLPGILPGLLGILPGLPGVLPGSLPRSIAVVGAGSLRENGFSENGSEKRDHILAE